MLRSDNVNLHQKYRELKLDNSNIDKKYEKVYIQVNCFEKKEFLVVCKKIINCTYILWGKNHMSKLFKYKFLYMIYKKLDKAYHYIYLFFLNFIIA